MGVCEGPAAAQAKLPRELRQQLLDALAAGTSLKEAIADLDLSSGRVWGLAQHDDEWSRLGLTPFEDTFIADLLVRRPRH